ncbi:MAG: 4Fe-4S dicluster domain-containing protein [Anaerolineales bacterium]|jgi:ferredoxin
MKFIPTDRLETLLDQIADKYQLIAPVREGERCFYRPISNSGQVEWDYGRPTLSAKEIFFPPTERLLEILPLQNEEGDARVLDYQIVETIPGTERVVFGVRPCDARGLRSLDALFIEQEPVDAYYAHRRQQTTLIGIACETMMDSCFCTTMGGAPDEREHVDLLLHRTEGGYIVDAVTERGAELFAAMTLDPWEKDLPAYDYQPGWELPDREQLVEHFDDRYWQVMSERCMSCRLCAYVCPTCRCFDVRDERLPTDNGGAVFERIRVWDSCARPGYRMIAGGHNPRAEKGERLRNRFLCKLYYYEEQYGETGCTGCGRCVDLCPVNIDITEVMHALAEREGAS